MIFTGTGRAYLLEMVCPSGFSCFCGPSVKNCHRSGETALFCLTRNPAGGLSCQRSYFAREPARLVWNAWAVKIHNISSPMDTPRVSGTFALETPDTRYPATQQSATVRA